MTLELALPETEVFAPENLIGQGAIREAYISGDFVLKVMKPNARISKKMYFRRVSILTQEFVRKKYHINDFNRYEFEQYSRLIQQVPANLLDSFAKILGVKEIQRRSTSINELVTDADGSISRTLADTALISDAGFWGRMDELEQFFLERGILHLGIHERNVVVRRTDEVLPVIVDYKRMGKNVYPRTIGMLFSYGRARKTKKKFQIMKEKYKL